jgi:hypothetical protein
VLSLTICCGTLDHVPSIPYFTPPYISSMSHFTPPYISSMSHFTPHFTPSLPFLLTPHALPQNAFW